MPLHMLEWLKILKLIITILSESVKYLELSYVDDGNVKGCELGKTFVATYKFKSMLTT